MVTWHNTASQVSNPQKLDFVTAQDFAQSISEWIASLPFFFPNCDLVQFPLTFGHTSYILLQQELWTQVASKGLFSYGFTVHKQQRLEIWHY